MDHNEKEDLAAAQSIDHLTLTETRTFASNEMVACEQCARLSAPTRIECLYCGAPLPRNERNEEFRRRPTLYPLEAGEHGFNAVFMPEANQPAQSLPLSQDSVTEAALWLNLSATDLNDILEAGVPVPLARAASMDEAQLVAGNFNKFNLNIAIFADDDLTSPTLLRARKIQISDESLTLTGGEGTTETRASWPEIISLVAGRIVKRGVEVEERRGRAKSEVVDEREIVSDKHVLDIYVASDKHGAPSAEAWRIESDGFDFSCLGTRKRLLAAENFTLLIETLMTHREGAHGYDDSYKRVRRLLAHVWPLDERTESRGLRRASVGRFNTEAVTIISNEAQFTRYSHLCYQTELLRRNHEPRQKS